MGTKNGENGKQSLFWVIEVANKLNMYIVRSFSVVNILLIR